MVSSLPRVISPFPVIFPLLPVYGITCALWVLAGTAAVDGEWCTKVLGGIELIARCIRSGFRTLIIPTFSRSWSHLVMGLPP